MNLPNGIFETARDQPKCKKMGCLLKRVRQTDGRSWGCPTDCPHAASVAAAPAQVTNKSIFPVVAK